MIEVVNFTKNRVDKKYFQKIGEVILKKLRQPKDAEVSLAFINDEEMKKLNRKYRGKNKTTDVLSFPNFPQEPEGRLVGKLRTRRSQPQAAKAGIQFITPEQEKFLGEIVISVPQAKKQARLRQGFGGQAKKRNYPLKTELTELFVHGILHLVGYEDETGKGYERMMKKHSELMGFLTKS